MSELGHDLHTLFPAHREILHALKLESPHYRELAHRHHELTRQIYRIEGGLDATSDDRLEDLKKQHLRLLDEVAELIADKLDARCRI
ncbi:MULTISPECIES: YdcH family protein [Sphingomonadaceae]|uniref:YdcH family protein n=1 Tax=Sphingomonadales TaxID=204457 RepID=UPI0007703376|nr:DUF465 domain-containing protein [Sphingobium sp. TKS]AMK23001.1 hypothetical protein K426_10290 [Sphingobium sp. TKS]MCF8706738.1 DUF465 domain-containing protein [Rhizorhapis sp. SPR117]